MSKRDKAILCLLAAAIILFCAIQFAILPAQEKRQAEYSENQKDALTHDISAIEDFKSPYVGNASNVGNLFYALPLNDRSMKFQIDSDTCSLTVRYQDAVQNIGKEKAYRNLLYNSVAAMAAIDNLAAITYEFSDDVISFDRQELELAFGAPLSELLDVTVWEEEVQSRLASSDFVEPFFAK